MNFVDNTKVHVMLQGGTNSAATDATNIASLVDTKGWERAHIVCACPSHNTETAAWSSITVQEGSSTDATNFTAIAAASFATEASTSASNVLPVATVTGPGGGVVQVNLGLKTRARYLRVFQTKGGLATNHGNNVNVILLSKGKESADVAADKRLVNTAENTETPAFAVVNVN